MLTRERLQALLAQFSRVRVAVVGDFFLDRYLVTDPRLAERSLETRLEARQVVARRSSPGHAGTVTNNLRALGVATIYAVGFTGEDGEGYELRRGLVERGVDVTLLASSPEVVTGAYLKPAALQPDGTERELERLDIKNRRPLPPALEEAMIERVRRLVGAPAPLVDAVIVADQVEERNCGAITDRVREAICALAAERPDVVWYADSRRRIGEYRGLFLKPNRDECLRAAGGAAAPTAHPAGVASVADVADVGGVAGGAGVAGVADLEPCARALAGRAGKTVFLTLSEQGLLVVEPGGAAAHVPAVRVDGPVDPTGAGDSTTAGIVPALALGASAVEAARLGALVAGVTVRQLGATGTATPAQVLAAFDGLPA